MLSTPCEGLMYLQSMACVQGLFLLRDRKNWDQKLKISFKKQSPGAKAQKVFYFEAQKVL